MAHARGPRRSPTRLAGGVLALLGVAAGCGVPLRDRFAEPVDGGLAVRRLDVPRPASSPYRIQPGDGLSLRFYRNPELDGEVLVRPDGMISLPLIDDVQAAGLTPAALGRDVEARYTGELAVPDVTVVVTRVAGQRVYVGGEVENPSELELPHGMTVLGAIHKAGGFKNSARLNQVILIRTGEDGRPRGASLDFHDVVDGSRPDQDVALEPWDIVVVPRSTVADVNAFVELYVTRNLPGGGVWFNLLGTM